MQEIRARKAETKKQMKESADRIRTTTHNLFAPSSRGTSKMASFMRAVNQGLAVYEGVMAGMKVARNIRRIFRKRR